MEFVALIIAIIALVIAILAYQKAGGAADLKKQAEVLSNLGDSIVKATDTLRDKTADVFDKVEGAIRGKEEEKPKPKETPKKEEPKPERKTATPRKKETK